MQFRGRRITFPRRRMASLAAVLLLASACGEMVEGASSALAETPEYRPQDIGTVDQSLCLLGFTGIPLTHLVTGHHLVEASVNGRPARFIVDTGANISVINSVNAANFGLEESAGGAPSIPIPAISTGGTGKARQARIDSMTVGGLPVRQSTIMVADLGEIMRVLSPLSGGQLDGLIGQDLLNEHRAVIDVKRPLLYMIAADQDPAPVPAERCMDLEAAMERES